MNITSILERAREAKHKQLVTAEEEQRFSLLIQKLLGSIASNPFIKGEKGDMPIRGIDYFTPQDIADFLEAATPVLGTDYFTEQEKAEMLSQITPRKGIHYFDGNQGEKGIPGKQGKPGKDGIANLDEVQSLIQRQVLDHETSIDHSLIHDPFLIGTKKIDESTIGDGFFLRYDSKRDRYIFSGPPKDTYVPRRKDWFPSDGVGLPGQNGNSGKFLTTDGTIASWSTVSSSSSSSASGQTPHWEIPAGTIDGVNATFTLSATPNAGSEGVYLTGVLQAITNGDYTIAGSIITFTTPPATGSFIRVFYSTGSSSTGTIRTYRAISTAQTILATDDVVDCTSGTFNLTLPTAVGITGTEYTVKNSGSGVITLKTTSAQTIDGASTKTLTQFNSLTVLSNGAGWLIL